MTKIKCRICGGFRCEHGDHCKDCGCPNCGFPGQRERGFCADCEWEIPGAKQVYALRPKDPQMFERMREFLGLPADVVGRPILDPKSLEIDPKITS